MTLSGNLWKTASFPVEQKSSQQKLQNELAIPSYLIGTELA